MMKFSPALALAALTACSVNAPQGPSPLLPDAGPAADAGVDAGTADAGTTPSVCGDDLFEPNDTLEAAASLEEAQDTDLAACPGNEDWYWINIGEDRNTRIMLAHDGEGDIDLQVLNLEGAFAASVERNGRTIITEPINDEGKLLVLVTNPSRRAAQYTLSIEAEAPSCESDRYENNNSAQGAERITGGEHPDLTFCGDVDYYRFSAPADSLILAELRTELGSPGNTGLRFELLDDSGDRVVATGERFEDMLLLEHSSERESVYFIKISGPETLNIGYDLYLERAVEGNNTCEQAERIELRRNEEIEVEGATRGMDNNFVPECGHRDNEPRSAAADVVYALVVPEGGGTLVAELRSRTDGYDPVLHIRSACDDASTEMNCNDDHRGGEDMRRTDARLEEGLEEGVYYLIADGFRTTSGEFELSVRLNYEEPDPGPSCETAQEVEVPRNGRLVLPVENDNARRQYAPQTCAERSGEQGRERAFAFTLDRPAVLDAYTGFSDRGESYDTVLYLLRGCGGNDEIACHDDIGRDNKLSRLSEVELEAGTYTIVADGFYERSVGAVSLVMELSDP
ncbi:MAG: hypothetical protein VYB65_04865 [Myxococcota bacterium]|nr:hypothetical protein [Myxococcota bacterium]